MHTCACARTWVVGGCLVASSACQEDSARAECMHARWKIRFHMAARLGQGCPVLSPTCKQRDTTAHLCAAQSFAECAHIPGGGRAALSNALHDIRSTLCSVQISRMTLEVAHFPDGRPSSAGLRQAVNGLLAGTIPRTAWKPSTVSVTLPPWTSPTKVPPPPPLCFLAPSLQPCPFRHGLGGLATVC